MFITVMQLRDYLEDEPDFLTVYEMATLKINKFQINTIRYSGTAWQLPEQATSGQEIKGPVSLIVMASGQRLYINGTPNELIARTS